MAIISVSVLDLPQFYSQGLLGLNWTHYSWYLTLDLIVLTSSLDYYLSPIILCSKNISYSSCTQAAWLTLLPKHCAVQFSSVTQSCPTLCNPMDYSTPGFPVHHQFLELAHTHVHWVSDAIQPYHLLSSPSLPAFSLSHHQGLFQCVSSLLQVAKVLEFQLQHQSFQWTLRTVLL